MSIEGNWLGALPKIEDRDQKLDLAGFRNLIAAVDVMRKAMRQNAAYSGMHGIVPRPERPLGRGIPGGGGSIMVVPIQKDGGDEGGDASQCSFTYTLYAWDDDRPVLKDPADETEARNRPSLFGRQTKGKYLTPTEGGLGIVWINPTSKRWELLIPLPEQMFAGVC